MREWIRRHLPGPVLRMRWRKYYWSEFNGNGEAELKELPGLVPPDKMAIDVGGSVGTYSFHLSRLAKSLVVFEPNPVLHWRFPKMNLPNARLEKVALSDKPGRATLRVPANSAQHGLASLEAHLSVSQPDAIQHDVEVRTIDSYGFENVGFVKIDTEGHEEAVLRGASDMIERCHPTFLIEIEEVHNPGGLERVNAFFKQRGYSCSFFDAGQRKPFSEFDATRDQNAALAARGPGQRYINNFIFQHEGG